jgi:hypothetical protein
MYLKLLLLTFIFIFSNYHSFAQSDATVNNPADEYVKAFESDSLLQNPSQHDICKLTADFNSDGIKDIAISDSYLCGVNTCDWEIYLGLGNDGYKYFSKLRFNIYAIQIDPVAKGASNIFIYDKAGSGVGDIIEYNLSSANGIKEIYRKTIHPETFPENEDYKYYKSIFTQSAMVDSCINVLKYLKTKKLEWKHGN